MKKLQKNKTLTAIALVLMLALTLVLATIPISSAQGGTPDEWRKLLTQTPDGAWRPTPSVTEYPWVCSPSGNPERTGYTDSPGPLSNHTLWRADIPLHNWGFGLVANGTVYTISMDQNAIFALDSNTGQEVWHYSLPITEETPASYSIFGPWPNDNWIQVVKNQILTGKGDEDKTIMIGTQSGDLEWISPEGRVALVSPPGTVFDNGYAVFLTFWGEQRTICYELRYDEQIKMTKRWESSNVSDRLSYYEGKIYGVVHGSKWVSCADAATGDLIWNYTTPDPEREFYQHGVIADGKAYFPMSYANKVVVLDANTGTFLWDLVIDDADYFSYVAVAQGRLYISGGTESKVYCVDATDGSQIWEFQTAGAPEYYHPTVAQDKVYFTSAAAIFTGYPMPGTYSGYVYCLDAMTGDLVWKYLTPEATVNAWIADGKIYSSAPFGNLWCWGAGPTTTTAAATSQTLALGETTTIYGSVEDMSPFSQEHPEIQYPWVLGEDVVLCYLDDAGGWSDFATTTTNDFGQYQADLTPTSEGVYTVYARFEGSDAFYWSSGQTTVRVNAATGATPSTPSQATDTYIVASTIAILAAIAIAVFLILRKK